MAKIFDPQRYEGRYYDPDKFLEYFGQDEHDNYICEMEPEKNRLIFLCLDACIDEEEGILIELSYRKEEDLNPGHGRGYYREREMTGYEKRQARDIADECFPRLKERPARTLTQVKADIEDAKEEARKQAEVEKCRKEEKKRLEDERLRHDIAGFNAAVAAADYYACDYYFFLGADIYAKDEQGKSPVQTLILSWTEQNKKRDLIARSFLSHGIDPLMVVDGQSLTEKIFCYGDEEFQLWFISNLAISGQLDTCIGGKTIEELAAESPNSQNLLKMLSDIRKVLTERTMYMGSHATDLSPGYIQGQRKILLWCLNHRIKTEKRIVYVLDIIAAARCAKYEMQYINFFDEKLWLQLLSDLSYEEKSLFDWAPYAQCIVRGLLEIQKDLPLSDSLSGALHHIYIVARRDMSGYYGSWLQKEKWAVDHGVIEPLEAFYPQWREEYNNQNEPNTNE